MAEIGYIDRYAAPATKMVGGFGGGGSDSGANGGGVDYNAVLRSFANKAGAAPAPAAPAITNTSTANPGIGYANTQLKSLYEGGGNVDALGRQAAGNIRDDAENLRKGARDSAARRGVGGGSIESLANTEIDRAVLQEQGKARVGIANAWEERKQGVLRDYAGNAATDENLQNQQRVTGLNQANLAFSREDAARQAQRDQWNDVLSLFGGSRALLGNA